MGIQEIIQAVDQFAETKCPLAKDTLCRLAEKGGVIVIPGHRHLAFVREGGLNSRRMVVN